MASGRGDRCCLLLVGSTMDKTLKNKKDVGGRKGVEEGSGSAKARVRVVAGKANLRGSSPSGAVSSAGGSNEGMSACSASDAESMSSSCCVTLEDLSPYWRKQLESYGKRRHEGEIDSQPASTDDEAASTSSVVLSKRGRGRPPSTGRYVGHAAAQANLKALRREEEQRIAEEEMAAKVSSHKAKRVVQPPPPEASSGLTHDLVKQVEDATKVVLQVAAKSGNLKGPFVKGLKEAAASIMAAVEELQASKTTEEVAKLQAANARQRAEMAELRKEMAELRAKLANAVEGPPAARRREPSANLPTSSPTEKTQQEELIRSIMLQVGGMLNARLESMEERLLPEKTKRPPLAAEKRASGNRVEPEAEQAPKPAQPKKSGNKKKEGNKGETSQGSREQPCEQPREQPPTAEAQNEGWSKVTKKKKNVKKAAPQKKASGPKPAQSSKTASRPAAKKLRIPRSAAIVITLQPEAEGKGVTYANVLADAKSKIDLSSCGISNLRFRKAATGARILEVAGEASAEKADSLAGKLREALGENLARISRPTKCAEFRIIGLDDSVSKPEIVDAVAQRGGCLKETVKVIGEIRRSPQGTGVAVISCPVAATKRIADEGRLLIGWVSARVEMLQARPMRCYRCLHIGHTRAMCTEEVDRSNECYQCGCQGHQSSTCSAEPKCSLCAAAQKPSAHRLGSKACAAPKPRKQPRQAAANGGAASSSPPSQTGGEMEAD